MLMCVYALSPLAVIVAEVLVDGGFQLKEVLLNCSPDGSLNYPGKTQKTHQCNLARFLRVFTSFLTVCDDVFSSTKKGIFHT